MSGKQSKAKSRYLKNKYWSKEIRDIHKLSNSLIDDDAYVIIQDTNVDFYGNNENELLCITKIYKQLSTLLKQNKDANKITDRVYKLDTVKYYTAY